MAAASAPVETGIVPMLGLKCDANGLLAVFHLTLYDGVWGAIGHRFKCVPNESGYLFATNDWPFVCISVNFNESRATWFDGDDDCDCNVIGRNLVFTFDVIADDGDVIACSL